MSTDQTNEKPPDAKARKPRNWKFSRKELDRALPGPLVGHMLNAKQVRGEALREKQQTVDESKNNNQAK